MNFIFKHLLVASLTLFLANIAIASSSSYCIDLFRTQAITHNEESILSRLSNLEDVIGGRKIQTQFLTPNRELINLIRPLFEQTYRGDHLDLSNEKLSEYSRFLIIAEPSSAHPVAVFTLTETAFGFKVGLHGHDGSKLGILSILQYSRILNELDGFYAEVSGPSLKLAEKVGTTLVTAAEAQRVLNDKRLEIVSDSELHEAALSGHIPDSPLLAGKVYRRFVAIAGKFIYKVVVGKPYAEGTKWHDRIDFKNTEALLASGNIVRKIPISEYLTERGQKAQGTTPVFFVDLDNGIRGVWKKDVAGSAYAEVAAYQISNLLGFKLVPPTILREVNNELGSFQYFVEASFLKSTPEPARNDLLNMNALYFLMGQWDRHSGNQIIDKAGGLALIDNTGIQSPVEWQLGQFPFIAFSKLSESGKRLERLDEQFPQGKTEELNSPNEEEFFAAMMKYTDLKVAKYYWEIIKNWHNQSFSLVPWKGHLWVRWVHNDSSMKPIEIESISRKMLMALQGLNRDALVGLNNPILSKHHIDRILDRRLILLKGIREGKIQILEDQELGSEDVLKKAS